MFKRTVVSYVVPLLISFGSSAQIQLKITLSGVPSSVNIVKKNLKYGKYGAFCFIYDDRVLSALDGLTIMPTYTDGAGNTLHGTGTIASNGVNIYGLDAGVMSLQQLKTFIDNNWGISCHGYIHGIPQSWIDDGYTVYDNVINNRRYHYNELKELGAEYVLRTGVGPNNDYGYQIAWKQVGDLCGTSQNTYDTYPANPAADWVNNSIGDISNLSNQYQVFARAMGDITTQDAANVLVSKLTSLIQQSTSSANKLLVFGTHSTDNTFLSQAFNYLQSNANDQIWITSLHELAEYGETKAKTDITYSLSGNVLTVNLSQNLPDAARWRDISLGLISDKNIVSIEYTGADNLTYNSTTGLINVFEKKMYGFTDPDPVGTVLPIHFMDFSNVSGELHWSVAGTENLSHFEVEKSTDGKGFNVIGITTAESYKDASVAGNQFYRIKAVETNGNVVYSKILHLGNPEKSAATVVRSGSNLRIHYYSEKEQKGSLEIYNSGGQLIYKTNQTVTAGWNLSEPPAPTSPGIYIIRVLNETIRYSNVTP